MSPTDLLAGVGLLPLKAIVFQSLLLLVAIALEAMVLRQHLRLGYQASVQYAATLNLIATSIGWIVFLSIEAVLPPALRQQIISYVLFSRFFSNGWRDVLPVLVVLAAIGAFFVTYWIKLQSLRVFVTLMGQAPLNGPALADRSRRGRSSRRGASNAAMARTATYTVAVLQANALSFTAIVPLLLLQLQVMTP